MGNSGGDRKTTTNNDPASHTHAGVIDKKSYVQAEESRSRFKELDPARCARVIRDGDNGPELIITGSCDDTFGQACRANWLFKSVNRKSKWFIKDERGNDVTETPLRSVDGIFIIYSERGLKVKNHDSDESDENYSYRDSVTYYD
jgi:hypothetical protein